MSNAIPLRRGQIWRRKNNPHSRVKLIRGSNNDEFRYIRSLEFEMNNNGLPLPPEAEFRSNFEIDDNLLFVGARWYGDWAGGYVTIRPLHSHTEAAFGQE